MITYGRGLGVFVILIIRTSFTALTTIAIDLTDKLTNEYNYRCHNALNF